VNIEVFVTDGVSASFRAATANTSMTSAAASRTTAARRDLNRSSRFRT
jgi:hypothetical protein